MFADVTSANVVGYTTSKEVIPDYWYIMASSFENIANANGEFPINELITGDITAGETMETSARIQTRVDGLAYGYWYNAKGKRIRINPGINPPKFEYVPAWCEDGGSVLAEGTIKNGQGFWFKDPLKASTITIAGQVTNLKVKSWPAGVYWDLVCNPFPVALKINSDQLDCSKLTAGETEETSARIQTRVDGLPYGYWYNAKGKRIRVNPGVNPPKFEYVPAWCEDGGSTLADEAEIAVGQGFWLQNPVDGAEIIFNF